MKKTIVIKKPLDGKQQQVQLVKNIVQNDTFFPKGVHIEDIDRTVRDKITKDFEITSEGAKVPLITMFSLERYTEFMQFWKHSDNTNTIQLPFMCLVREEVKKGTNLGENYNVPSTPTFNLWKRPIMKNGKATVEYYQIAQPVNIDCFYKLHLFTKHPQVVNKLDELMLHSFKEYQNYIFVNGHSMPLILEEMSDESQTSIDTRRFYHKVYSMTLKGYLLREEDFKKLSSVDKVSFPIYVSSVKNSQECIVTNEDLDCDLCLNFQFNRKSGNSKTYKVPMDLEFYYDNQNSNNNYGYFLNGISTNLPFIARRGDELTVAHNINRNVTLNIKICGRKL